MKWATGLPKWTTPARTVQTYVELPDNLGSADKGDAEYQDELIHTHIQNRLRDQFAGNVPLDFDWDEQIKEPDWQKQLQAKEKDDDWYYE